MMALKRVERPVLVSSAGGLPLIQISPSEGLKVIRSYYGGEGPSREKMRRYLEMMMYDPALVTDELSARIDERYEASMQPDFITQAPEGHAWSQAAPEPRWKDLDRIKTPTLVIWGRDNVSLDMITRSSC
jgi:4,5:9,10-diseco-3-hydroxy-5,9,17-trioxoandrosta-1(10),2-diene-4-oate hydrolase